MRTEFSFENLKGREHSEDLRVDERIILEWILWKHGGKLPIVFIWLRIGMSGRLL
jgi:hypothetical protein